MTENWDVDVAIDHTGYQSCSFYLASLTFECLWYSSSTAYAISDNSKTENTILVELWALLISGPYSYMHKGQSCKSRF